MQPTATFDPAETIVLRNLTDVPSTRSIVRLTDAVKIDEATYYNTPSDGHAKGDLVVSARTSDDQNTAPLTVVDVGSLPVGGAADAPAHRHLRRRPRRRHLGPARHGEGHLGDGRLGQCRR